MFKNSTYTCTGNISEWSKCIKTVKTPNRVPAQIPEKYRTFLRGNFKVRTRILNDVPQMDDDDYAYVELKMLKLNGIVSYFSDFQFQLADCV